MDNILKLKVQINELKLTKRLLVLSGKDVSNIDKEIYKIKQELVTYSNNKSELEHKLNHFERS